MKKLEFNEKDLRWKKFVSTGSVNDYLSYTIAKKEIMQRENYNFEDKYKGLGDFRTNS